MKWFALVVPSQRELAAVRELSRIGCRAFAPVEYRAVRVSPHRKAKAVEPRPHPLFSRYVFAESPDWYEIRQLQIKGKPLVTSVLSSNGQPYRLPALEVLHLLNLGENGPPQTIDPARNLQAGDHAVIADGPFKGHAVKVAHAGYDSARVLVNVFNSLREIAVPISMLEAA